MKSCESCYSNSINVDPQKVLCDTCYYRDHFYELLLSILGGNYVLLENDLEKAMKKAREVLNGLS